MQQAGDSQTPIEEEYKSPSPMAVMLIRAFLLTVVVLVVIFVGELATRLLLPQNLSGSWRELSPRGVLYNKPDHTARHQFGERVVYYRINSQNLRGGPVRPEAVKVLFLGDSYTFGWLLEEEDTYIEQLAGYAKRDLGDMDYQFLNGAGGGWGLADELAFLEDRGEQLRPAFVVQFLNFDDVRRAAVRGLYRVTDASTLDLEASTTKKNLTLKSFMNALPLYDWLLEHSQLLQLARQTAIRGLTKPSSAVGGTQVDAEAATLLAKAIYRRMNRWSEDHGARLLVVTTGVQRHFFRQALQKNKVPSVDAVFGAQARAFFASEGIPFEDTSSAVEAATGNRIEDYLIPLDGHVTEAGAAIIAEQAWPFLRRQLEEREAEFQRPWSGVGGRANREPETVTTGDSPRPEGG